MTDKYLSATIVVLTMIISTAQGTETETLRLFGSDLARDCSTSEHHFSYGSCAGYLMGVADMMAQPEWPYSTKACFPDEVGRGELIAIVKKYIAKHSNRLQDPALDIVATALARAFPCPTR
jgi:hypothetical protein